MTDIKAFLWRGALAGMLGGVLAALFQWAVTEDQIRVALAIEEANAPPGGEAPLFDRTEQEHRARSRCHRRSSGQAERTLTSG